MLKNVHFHTILFLRLTSGNWQSVTSQGLTNWRFFNRHYQDRHPLTPSTVRSCRGFINLQSRDRSEDDAYRQTTYILGKCLLILIRSRSCENVSYGICEQQRCRSACYPHSLISTFIVRCLDSMLCILAISKVSKFLLASVAEQAGLNVTWSKIPEDTFSRDVAHLQLAISHKLHV